MRLNPTTLEEETEEGRLERQVHTGVIGNGLTVICIPNPNEPMAQEYRSRATCLTQPFTTCKLCRHSVFTLVFDANAPKARYELIACPRWKDPGARLQGKLPDFYVPVEAAACEKKELEFCPSCPPKEELVQIYSADKKKEGWYSRYARLRAEEFEDG